MQYGSVYCAAATLAGDRVGGALVEDSLRMCTGVWALVEHRLCAHVYRRMGTG